MIGKTLGGVKVLEFAESEAAPYCTKLLADFGAEVIKIEKPGIGDIARRRGPFLNDVPHPEKSGLFLYLNTNKRGVTLDPKTAKGREIFLDLVKWADILVEDNSPKEMESNELKYDKLKEINPKLVMTSITPFGQTGPYRDYKMYHLNMVHASGGGFITPSNSPNLDREPVKADGIMEEGLCGISAALATMSALFWRNISGKGQFIDISRQEAIMNIDRVEIDQYPNEGFIASRMPRKGRVASGLIPCKDGYFMAMAMDDRQWEGMIKVMDYPEWSKDDMFKDASARAKYGNEMFQHVAEWAKDKTKNEIYHKAQVVLWPATPVYSINEAVNWVQCKERDFFVEIDHPETGK
ncbi:MAG: CoA transferase, partial [Spirochaetota bacterium]|nr:CoA transferase [Spirochaetota bacterium]